MKGTRSVFLRLLSAALCSLLLLQGISAAAPTVPAEDPRGAFLLTDRAEPREVVSPIPGTGLEQHVFTFSTLPSNGAEMAQYEPDSPYKAMALLILAFRAWTPENPTDCLEMLDCLTDTGSTIAGSDTPCPFSRYTPWVSALNDRMTQNDKYRYIGNAYLGGATAENDYTPDDPVTVTLRQSAFEPYAEATEESPALYQVLVSLEGADSDRYCLFFRDGAGNWRVYGRSWINLLADVKTPEMDILLPPETGPLPQVLTQSEPTVKTETLPARAAGVDESGNPIVIDTTVEQYTFTFSTVPACYEDIIQYKLDSPYKTMALYFLALRTWTPEDPDTCARMLDYLTNPNADSGQTDGQGKKLSKRFSEYASWTGFLKDRMTQNDKYRYIGNAYLGGASPENDYTLTEPVTVTLRQSVYDPYKAAVDGGSPELKQVLIHMDGADNDRYALLYQDQRGDWRFFSDHWKGLLADVQMPASDVLLPPETGPLPEILTQREPVETVRDIPAKVPGFDDSDNPIIIDTTVQEHTFTFSTVPTCYEDIIQYKLDSPYKTMALYFLALRTWTPEDPDTCARMLDYLTNPNMDSEQTDGQGKKLSKGFSQYPFWTDFLKDRMTQNGKYRYIGNAYLGGASPENDYTPTEPVTVTVRESVYNPYKPGEHLTDPTLYQVLIDLDGADNERYGLLYQDQRGDWRFFSDHWKGLLADVQTPLMDIVLPPETGPLPQVFTQREPVETVYEIPAKAMGEDLFGNPTVIDTTVKQHSFTFSTIPTCYDEIIQYKLDSPYKTMALLILAFRTWTPENKKDCLEMMDYLTNTAVDSGKTDASGRKLSRKCSEYQFWTDFLRDHMMQNNKYRYIGNAYLEGAMPSNDYTPTLPVTITLRESVYNPYKDAGGHLTDPALYQVLINIAGADNDRYAIFYQDPRGDWRVWGENWKGLLTDVKTPTGDIPLPPQVIRGDSPAHPQTEPELTVEKIDAMGVDVNDDPVPTTVDRYTFTFSTVPTCYEDIVQYELDSPYKTMALLFLAFRAWDPADPTPCLEMLDYLTNTAVPEPEVKDAQGRQLCFPFSRYYPWISFLQDRMLQNEKYGFIGNAYLKGASPKNDYTPDTPVTVVVRQSVYDPYKARTETSPELRQVLVSLEGADSDRYALFYQDQRGDWRVFGDHWKGLLVDVQPPRSLLSIYGALLDPEESTVSFRVNGLEDTMAAFAASYGHDGQMLGLSPAFPDENGILAASVLPQGERYQILLLDKKTGAPLCRSVKLSK